MNTILKLLALLSIAILMIGCTNTKTNASPPEAPTSFILADATYGVIDDIETVHEDSDKIGADTLVGGIVGGVLGNQVGGGSGNDIATAVGVISGAVVGHQIEKSASQHDQYLIQVRLERGGYQTITQGTSDLHVGDKVRVENNQVLRDLKP
jgi:outer membrane lipoprotein SlyB